MRRRDNRPVSRLVYQKAILRPKVGMRGKPSAGTSDSRGRSEAGSCVSRGSSVIGLFRPSAFMTSKYIDQRSRW